MLGSLYMKDGTDKELGTSQPDCYLVFASMVKTFLFMAKVADYLKNNPFKRSHYNASTFYNASRSVLKEPSEFKYKQGKE